MILLVNHIVCSNVPNEYLFYIPMHVPEALHCEVAAEVQSSFSLQAAHPTEGKHIGRPEMCEQSESCEHSGIKIKIHINLHILYYL